MPRPSRHLPSRHLPGRHLLVRLGLAAGITIAAAGCGDDPSRAEQFCGYVDANRQLLFSPTIVSPIDIDPVLDAYREAAAFTPLEIEPEWEQLVINYQTASTVVPADPQSVERAVAMALQSEQSAVSAVDWIARNCGIDVGPLATVVPAD